MWLTLGDAKIDFALSFYPRRETIWGWRKLNRKETVVVIIVVVEEGVVEERK